MAQIPDVLHNCALIFTLSEITEIISTKAQKRVGEGGVVWQIWLSQSNNSKVLACRTGRVLPVCEMEP